MKTSNILLTTVITLGIAVTLTMFLVTNYKEGKTLATEYIQKTSPLPSFSVIVALGHTEFTVEGCDTNQVKWRVAKEDSAKLHGAKIFVRNDTLFVRQTALKQAVEDRVVVCCKSLRSVSAKENDLVELRNLKTGTLDIHGAHCQIYVNNWGKTSTNPLELNILATDSANIDLYNVTISRLNATLSRRAILSSHEYVSVAEALIKRTEHSNYHFDRWPLNLLVKSDTTAAW